MSSRWEEDGDAAAEPPRGRVHTTGGRRVGGTRPTTARGPMLWSAAWGHAAYSGASEGQAGVGPVPPPGVLRQAGMRQQDRHFARRQFLGIGLRERV
jgi:hypothetical protein